MTFLPGSLFSFARPTRLRDVFPPSSTRGDLNPTELDAVVKLVHPAVGRGESLADFHSFNISLVAPGGDFPVATSVVPRGVAVYYLTFAAYHNQVLGLDVRFDYYEPSVPQNVVFESGYAQSGGTALWPTSVSLVARNIVCPPGLQLRAVFRAAGAGDTCTIEGIAAVLSLGEPPPPGF